MSINPKDYGINTDSPVWHDAVEKAQEAVAKTVAKLANPDHRKAQKAKATDKAELDVEVAEATMEQTERKAALSKLAKARARNSLSQAERLEIRKAKLDEKRETNSIKAELASEAKQEAQDNGSVETFQALATALGVKLSQKQVKKLQAEVPST
jgi:hypothetical protein